MQPSVDRPRLLFKKLRYLTQIEFFLVSQDNDRPVGGRQARDSLPDPFCIGPPKDLVLYRIIVLPAHLVQVVHRRLPRESAQTDIHGDAPHPGSELVPLAAFGELAVCLNEGFLDCILGILSPAQNPKGEAEDGGLAPLHQLAVVLYVAIQHPRDYLFVRNQE